MAVIYHLSKQDLLLPGSGHPQVHRCEQFNLIYFDLK